LFLARVTIVVKYLGNSTKKNKILQIMKNYPHRFLNEGYQMIKFLRINKKEIKITQLK